MQPTIFTGIKGLKRIINRYNSIFIVGKIFCGIIDSIEIKLLNDNKLSYNQPQCLPAIKNTITNKQIYFNDTSDDGKLSDTVSNSQVYFKMERHFDIFWVDGA